MVEEEEEQTSDTSDLQEDLGPDHGMDSGPSLRHPCPRRQKQRHRTSKDQQAIWVSVYWGAGPGVSGIPDLGPPEVSDKVH